MLHFQYFLYWYVSTIYFEKIYFSVIRTHKIFQICHLHFNIAYDFYIVSFCLLFYFILFILFCLFRATLQHTKVPRLGIKSELQLPAYATATATPDPSCVWDLHHSSWQHWILNPLSRARDQTCVLMDTSQVHYHWATMGTPFKFFKWNLPASFFRCSPFVYFVS